jgi:hypothetical protein
MYSLGVDFFFRNGSNLISEKIKYGRILNIFFKPGDPIRQQQKSNLNLLNLKAGWLRLLLLQYRQLASSNLQI